MTAATQNAGLTADERSDIRRTVLDARQRVEDDLRRQLQRYGIYEDEKVPVGQLDHLTAHDIETRETIDAALEREMAATEDDYERSLKNYVREATKTHLNRLVALKAIEVRGLVTETLTERPEYGNRSEILRAVDEVAGELTEQQDGGLGVALNLAYTELSDEIGVIFEENEYTAVEPDFAVREEVIEQLNELDESIWESDEAMGWVYQYFGENEREEIDERIDEENYKVQDTDVATKTQLFTPRYIVEWMVDNSLGRLWLEMHGEQTNIDDEDNCFYLAPLEESLIDREAKDVRDIKVLDPACGSGHMLFYAFDVLYEMYLEQGDVAEKYIPREILANNLYGIDIDPGAAQLAALALYVKGKSKEPDVEIEQINIVSADAVLVNGEKKEEVLAQTDSELERRVLEQVWRSFEHIREWGSLVRIEERIEEIIDEELEEVRATGQTKFTDDGLAKQSSVISFSGEEESWEQVKERLLSQVSELAEEALERNDPIEEMFVGEVEKSVHLLDLFVEDYDAVISNPPYLGSRKMEETLKQYVKDNYKGSRDLYTAFIERCTELANEDDYVSMVTPESFMFLYSYRGLRKELVSDVQIIEGMHVSRYGFDQAKDSYTIPFILRKRDPEGFTTSRFYRMTHEQKEYQNYSDKISGLNAITSVHREGQIHEDVYTIDQSSFLEIGRTPIIYWFGQEVLNLFQRYPLLDEIADVVQGLGTGNDDRFVRKWWEIDQRKANDKFTWYVQSGSDSKYYDSTEELVLWGENGNELKKYGECTARNEEYYKKEGVNFRDFSKYFTARYHPENHIHSKAAHLVYIDEQEKRINLLGYLSSSLVRYIMAGINPGLHFQVGDAKNIPINKQIFEEDRINELVQVAVDRRKQKYSMIETKREFDGQNLIDNFDDYNYVIDLIEADISIIHGIIDQIIFDVYGITDYEYIYDDLPKNKLSYDHIGESGELDTSTYKFRSHVSISSVGSDQYNEVVESISEIINKDIEEISELLEISPYTIAHIRRENDMYTKEEEKEIAGRLLSYFIGVVFGHWDNSEQVIQQSDGILVFDEQFDNNISDRIRQCIEDSFEDLYEIESKIEKQLNKNIDSWLRENYFRYHHCKEYRRRGQRIPIYWHLESDQGAFSCFVYYHTMDSDTLPKLRGQYIDEKLDTLQNRLDAIESELNTAQGDRARELRAEKEDIQADIDDITEFRDRVDALIDEGFEPDFEAGIWENIQKVDEHDLLTVPLDKL